jgi:hypothetical protein
MDYLEIVVLLPAEARDLFRTTLGPIEPHIQWVPWVLSTELKKPGHDTDHLSPSSVKDKNQYSYTCTPTYTFLVYKFTFSSLIISVKTRMAFTIIMECMQSDKSPKVFSF